MSKAFCCDVCQKCFNPLHTGAACFTTIENVYFQDSVKYEKHEYVQKMEQAHLCPDCTTKFWQFLQGAETVDKKLFDDLQEDYEYELEKDSVHDAFNAVGESLRRCSQFLRDQLRGLSESYKDVCDGKSSERESESEKDGLH